MPTYEYRCGACGHEFERFQRISDDPIRECPACGKEEAERLISTGGGIVFKGPGFYATDYRKESSPSGKRRSAESGGDAEGKPAGEEKKASSSEGSSGSDE